MLSERVAGKQSSANQIINRKLKEPLVAREESGYSEKRTKEDRACEVEDGEGGQTEHRHLLSSQVTRVGLAAVPRGVTARQRLSRICRKLRSSRPA